MSQTSYPLNQGVAFAGMKADSRFDEVESFAAEEAIPFGRGVTAEAGDTDSVRLAGKDNAAMLYDADFVTGNSITFVVNGTAITPVVFDTDQATTLAALVAAVDGLAGVSATSLAARTVNVEMEDGSTITVSSVVTGGASQATGTPTYSADDVFRGISLATQKEQNSSGVVQYEQYEAVSVLRKGVAWVETGVAVTADEDAYIDMTGAIGKFTNVSSGNLATGGKFRSTVAAAGLAKLEINLP
jgi:hypothetical protein